MILLLALQTQVHVWEKVEIVLEAEGEYRNPYAEVDVWVDLKGPARKAWGFWDGGKTFRVRIVATAPGEWTWTSGSSPKDPGLSGKTGSFTATEWTEEEKRENPNRRGFLRPTPNGHALSHADGTPFFLLGDTWYAASTWRYPLKGKPVPPDYVPGPSIGFEEAIQFSGRRGYNGFSMIAAFPSWHNDGHPAELVDVDGTQIRECLSWPDNRTGGAKDMRDEKGNRPFLFPGRAPTLKESCADFDRINPDYFKSLDAKMDYVQEAGFVVFLESIRRDQIPAWQKYHDFDVSFPRYVNYLAARYGHCNILLSAVHQDAGPYKLNRQVTLWHERYGGMPFGQPVTALSPVSTLRQFGHAEAPWLTLHGIGNHTPRDNTGILEMDRIFRLENPKPAITQEPYYAGTMYEWNLRPAAPTDSELDQYRCRVHAYGGVLSGGLGGHIYGTNAWDGDVEPRTQEWGAGNNYIHEALRFRSAAQMPHLRTFILSEGARFQDLELGDPLPRASGALDRNSMEGFTFMMRTPDKKLAMLYFEGGCRTPVLSNLAPGATYEARWFDPRTGRWLEPKTIESDPEAALRIPSFPGGAEETGPTEDWALKLTTR